MVNTVRKITLIITFDDDSLRNTILRCYMGIIKWRSNICLKIGPYSSLLAKSIGNEGKQMAKYLHSSSKGFEY